MPSKWQRDETEQLIIFVQQYECLYNVKSEEYMDRIKKAQALQEILLEMQKVKSDLTLPELKRKWRNMRTQYMQELRKFTQFKKRGGTDLYTPKLWCFDQLSFLNSNTHIHGQMRKHLKQRNFKKTYERKTSSTHTKWQREEVEHFIICMQQNECLYNAKSEEYLDRRKRDKTFQAILFEMQNIKSDVTLEELKRKWKNLRTQYTQELRKFILSKKYGKADLYVPKLWCFDQLSFLYTHVHLAEGQDDWEEMFETIPVSTPGKWRRDEVEKLIICVQQNECIYNANLVEYIDRKKRAQAFHRILLEMQKVKSDVTLEELKMKWKNLRTQYTEEMRKFVQSKKCGRTNLYVPKLWCFDQLSFLYTHIQMRESEDNWEESFETIPTSTLPENIEDTKTSFYEEAATSSHSDGNSSSSSSESPQEKKAKMTRPIDDINEDLKGIKTLLADRKRKKQFEWLGNLVVSRMQEIEPEYQEDAAWQVQCLMRELVQNNGDRNQNISTSSSTSPKDILALSMDGIVEE